MQIIACLFCSIKRLKNSSREKFASIFMALGKNAACHNFKKFNSYYSIESLNIRFITKECIRKK